MAWGDTTRKAEAQGGGVGSLAVTLNSTVAGNMVVAAHSSYDTSGTSNFAATTGYSDNQSNTYTQSFRTAVQASQQIAGVGYSVLTTGGNLTITIDPGTGSYDMSIYVHEFSGPHSTPASGTPVTAIGNSTTIDTGSFTPADADCLYVAIDGHTSSGTITENQSPGDTDWTLSNDHESGASAEPGSLVFFIRSGSAVARRSVWTKSGSTADFACGIAAFKPAAAGGGPSPRLMALMGVGR